MPSFANPFQGNVNRKMSNPELMQALRLDIAGELEAIYLYESHYLATDDPAAKAVLADIRDEEKTHVGELITLMRHLDPNETARFLSGEAEVNEMLADLQITSGAASSETSESSAEGPSGTAAEPPTVGSLLD